jgi:LPS export ABC transporter permease LptF/LPS export ABC transporter permease LptG
MGIIDRYVIRQLLLPFGLGLLVFTFVFIIPGLIQYAEEFIAKGVPSAVVLQAMLALVPSALALTIPMALLLGILVAFSRLSADREFVAMQACGLSVTRLLWPVGLVSVLCWAATAWVLMVAVPSSNQSFREILYRVVAARAEGEVRPHVFFTDFPNLVLYAREVPASGGWTGVFIADNRPGQPAATYLAKRGRVLLNREERTVQMVLEDGARHAADAAGPYEVTRFARLVLSVDPESIFPRAGPAKGENEMSIAELRARVAERQREGFSTHNDEMAIHRRFSIPIACLVFGLIGVALGATNRKDGTLGSFMLGLLVIFAYYVPLYLGPALAKGGLLAPWFAVWLPNLILGAGGVLLFIWRDRAVDRPLVSMAWLERLQGRQTTRSLNQSFWMRWPAVGILDRYVTMSYLRVFALAALGMAAIFYISTFLDLSDKVFKGDATWAMLGAYFWYATPQYVYYVIPLSVLMATLVTMGGLVKNNELIVMKACGISLYRIALPLLLCSVLAGLTLFALDEQILGPANRRAESLRRVMRGGSLDSDALSRRWIVARDGSIYNYNVFDAPAGRMLGLSVFEFDADMSHLRRRTFSETAMYAGGGLSADPRGWRLERGWTRDFDASGEPSGFEAFATTDRSLEPASYFGTEPPDARFMGFTQLRAYTARLQAGGFDVLAQQVALARKLSFPFVTVIMTIIAIPFAVTMGRGGALAGVGIGIALAMTYWTTLSIFAAMGAGGLMTPALAAWAPNLLFGAGAAYLLLTVRT